MFFNKNHFDDAQITLFYRIVQVPKSIKFKM